MKYEIRNVAGAKRFNDTVYADSQICIHDEDEQNELTDAIIRVVQQNDYLL